MAKLLFKRDLAGAYSRVYPELDYATHDILFIVLRGLLPLMPTTEVDFEIELIWFPIMRRAVLRRDTLTCELLLKQFAKYAGVISGLYAQQLYSACTLGDYALITDSLARLRSSRESHNNTVVGELSKNGHHDLLIRLFNEGAISMHNVEFLYVVRSAAWSGDMRVIELLRSLYDASLVDYTVTDFDVWNAGLSGACGGGHRALADRMISLGATNVDEGAQTAAEFGHLELMEHMISLGANNFDEMYLDACFGNITHAILYTMTKLNDRELIEDGLHELLGNGKPPNMTAMREIVQRSTPDLNRVLISTVCQIRPTLRAVRAVEQLACEFGVVIDKNAALMNIATGSLSDTHRMLVLARHFIKTGANNLDEVLEVCNQNSYEKLAQLIESCKM